MGRNVREVLSTYPEVTPDKLPRCSSYRTIDVMKSNINVALSPNDAGFYTVIDKVGASANIIADDTYVTVMDVTGSGGILTHCIGGCNAASTAGVQSTFKITVDGVEYVIVGNTSGVDYDDLRMFLGAMYQGPKISTVADSNSPYLGGYNDYGLGIDVAASNFQAPSIYRGILLSPLNVLLRGFAHVRFINSCKVEIKINDYSTTDLDERVAVAYLLGV